MLSTGYSVPLALAGLASLLGAWNARLPVVIAPPLELNCTGPKTLETGPDLVRLTGALIMGFLLGCLVTVLCFRCWGPARSGLQITRVPNPPRRPRGLGRLET